MKSEALDTFPTPSRFTFSAAKLGDLGSSRYTLVTILVDVSGSTVKFRKEMEQALRQTVEGCKFSDEADNLMIRVVTFDSEVTEVHGFLLLDTCDLDRYILPGSGWTALHDAFINGIEAMTVYATELTKNDFECNGVIIGITDGDHRLPPGWKGKHYTPADVRDAFEKSVSKEVMESLLSILVKVNVEDFEMEQHLKEFFEGAGFSQQIDMKDVSAKGMAELANFIVKSASSQSQSLGKGVASKPIDPPTF
jgi:hypothetical protein